MGIKDYLACKQCPTWSECEGSNIEDCRRRDLEDKAKLAEEISK